MIFAYIKQNWILLFTAKNSVKYSGKHYERSICNLFFNLGATNVYLVKGQEARRNRARICLCAFGGGRIINEGQVPVKEEIRPSSKNKKEIVIHPPL